MTSLLVTGAGGFIGRRVVRAATSAGYEVTALVRRSRVGGSQNVLQHDLRLPLSQIPAVDWILHLAGAYAGAGDHELRDTDLAMADNLIDWGVARGIKNWIFASAAEVYGHVSGPATEETPARPVIPYGRIKLIIERLFFDRTKDIPGRRVVVLRIGEVYGAESRLITELTARLRRGFCPWPGDGAVPLSFVHVDDVAQAFLRAVQNAPSGVSLYNVADDAPATWRDFLHRVAQLSKARPPLFLPNLLVHFYALCSTIAARATGNEPILTQNAVRLITTPKVLANTFLKHELRFHPRYPGYSEGLEEVFHGLSHHA